MSSWSQPANISSGTSNILSLILAKRSLSHEKHPPLPTVLTELGNTISRNSSHQPKAYCPISIDTDYDEVTIEFSDCCADIIGYEEGAEWTSDEVRWDPENYDVDVVYENIKNAVITVYAGIAECRMRYKFDKE